METTNGTSMEPEHVEAVAEVARHREAILGEIKKVIVGQDHVIEELLIALLARGQPAVHT